MNTSAEDGKGGEKLEDEEEKPEDEEEKPEDEEEKGKKVPVAVVQPNQPSSQPESCSGTEQ